MTDWEKLLTDHANTSFDCGNWNGEDDDLPPYETVWSLYVAAKSALQQAISALESELRQTSREYSELKSAFEATLGQLVSARPSELRAVDLAKELKAAFERIAELEAQLRSKCR